MKNWPLIVCAGLAPIFSMNAASAQSNQSLGQSNLTLSGYVDQSCALPPPSYTSGPGSFKQGSNSDATVALGASDFVDASTGTHRSVTFAITYPQAVL